MLTKIIPFALAGAAMMAGSYAFLSSSVPYVSITEARQRSGQQVHLAGEIVRGTDHLDIRSGTLEFDVKDEEGKQVRVVYRGTKPSNFDTAPKVSVSGCYREGRFHADQILVKCPSKYESKEAEGQANPH